jgi:uncharacterized Fe-S cluster protein YjdI
MPMRQGIVGAALRAASTPVMLQFLGRLASSHGDQWEWRHAMTSDLESEARFDTDVERIYSNETLEVTWAPSFCTHFRACVRGAPEVFNSQRRPWIDIEGAAPETILEVVSRCPTGALHARMLSGALDEGVDAFEPTAIHVQQDGPLFVRGHVRVHDPDGSVRREDVRLALCRCGASQNKPFCDDSHYRIGFKG